jgi:hypothetical protein
MRAALLLALSLFATAYTLAQGSFPTTEAGWSRHDGIGVSVFIPDGHESLGADMAQWGSADLTRIATALAVARPGPFPVYAYTDRVAFLRDTERDPYLAGVSYRPSGAIRVDATLAPNELRNTLAHELTHSLIGQKLGDAAGALPTWVDEGIAGHYAQPLTSAERRVAAQLTIQGPLSLDELESAFASGPDRGAAYVQTRAMAAWLEDQRSGALRDLLTAIAGGESFEKALMRTTGLTPQSWLDKWRTAIPWYLTWLTLSFSPVLFAPLALLVVLVVLIRAHRRRAEERAAAEAEELADEEEKRALALEELPPELITYDNPDAAPDASDHDEVLGPGAPHSPDT